MIKGKKQGTTVYFLPEKTVNFGVEKITFASAGRIAYGLAMIVFGFLHFSGAETLLNLIPDYMPFGSWFLGVFCGNSARIFRHQHYNKKV